VRHREGRASFVFHWRCFAYLPDDRSHDRFSGGEFACRLVACQPTGCQVLNRAGICGRRWTEVYWAACCSAPLRRKSVVVCRRVVVRLLEIVPVRRGGVWRLRWLARQAAFADEQRRSVALSALCLTRLETRTKESNMCASHWALSKPIGAAKAKELLVGLRGAIPGS
jgi:hypothetical protein